MSVAILDCANWLAERCEFLRNLEKEAEHVLQQEKDADKYRALMRQKALFLQALPEEAEDRLEGLPESLADAVAFRLENFSQNADRALGLDSVFYMSALLYPDQHQQGQPNNLEVLAAEVMAAAKQ